MKVTELVYVGSVARFNISPGAWGDSTWPQVIVQLYNQGAVAINASRILNNGSGDFLAEAGSFNQDKIYEIIERLSRETLAALADAGIPGRAPWLMAHYNDRPLEITFANDE